MRPQFICVIALALGSDSVFAQLSPPPAGYSQPQGTITRSIVAGGFLSGTVVDVRPAFWASSEYLYWRVKDASSPPLVTTADPNDAFPGALGQPGTTVIFGGNTDYGNFSGLRINLGGW